MKNSGVSGYEAQNARPKTTPALRALVFTKIYSS